jgi:serine protease Do
MEIQTLPPGAAVVQTVALGSPGERAGLQPGDVIIEVNHRSISGAGDIGAAISGLHAGDQIELQVSHGSGLYRTDATLAAPPSVHP